MATRKTYILFISECLVDSWKLVCQEIGENVFSITHLCGSRKIMYVGDLSRSGSIVVGLITNILGFSWRRFGILSRWKVTQTFVLKEKFKLLRGKLRTWNAEVSGWQDLKVEKSTKELNEIN